MKYLLPFIMFLCVMLTPSEGQQMTHWSRAAATPDVPTVAFCDLLKNPQMYNGKVIRTRAVFSRRGEEVTEFYCPDCLESGRVDFDTDEGYDACRKPAMGNGNTVNVTLTGRFVVAGPGEGFGHMGQWHYKLVVSCVEKANIISKHELSPDRLPKKVKRRATCR